MTHTTLLEAMFAARILAKETFEADTSVRWHIPTDMLETVNQAIGMRLRPRLGRFMELSIQEAPPIGAPDKDAPLLWIAGEGHRESVVILGDYRVMTWAVVQVKTEVKE